jgi:hypothetical protein
MANIDWFRLLGAHDFRFCISKASFKRRKHQRKSWWYRAKGWEGIVTDKQPTRDLVHCFGPFATEVDAVEHAMYHDLWAVTALRCKKRAG